MTTCIDFFTTLSRSELSQDDCIIAENKSVLTCWKFVKTEQILGYRSSDNAPIFAYYLIGTTKNTLIQPSREISSQVITKIETTTLPKLPFLVHTSGGKTYYVDTIPKHDYEKMYKTIRRNVL